MQLMHFMIFFHFTHHWFLSCNTINKYCCASQTEQANEKLQNKLEQLQHHAA